MMNKTHWKQLINPAYLGAYSLPEGEDLTVTILSVALEVVTSVGGKKEECTVAQLKNNKPFILNNTNCKTIAKLYGTPFIEEWAGKQITLFASTTKFAGDVVECLRIRAFVTPPPKPKMNEARFETAIKSIQAGTYSKQDLMNKADLTPEQIERVKSC